MTSKKIKRVLDRLEDTKHEYILRGYAYNVDLQEDFDVDTSDLSSEFARQGALYVYYVTLAARARADADIAKYELEETEAKTNIKVRKLLAASSAKVTEKLVDSTIKLDEKVIDAKVNLVYAQETYNLLKGYADSMKVKSDMLIRLGAQQRAEMGANISMNEYTEPGNAMRDAVAGIEQNKK